MDELIRFFKEECPYDDSKYEKIKKYCSILTDKFDEVNLKRSDLIKLMNKGPDEFLLALYYINYMILKAQDEKFQLSLLLNNNIIISLIETSSLCIEIISLGVNDISTPLKKLLSKFGLIALCKILHKIHVILSGVFLYINFNTLLEEGYIDRYIKEILKYYLKFSIEDENDEEIKNMLSIPIETLTNITSNKYAVKMILSMDDFGAFIMKNITNKYISALLNNIMINFNGDLLSNVMNINDTLLKSIDIEKLFIDVMKLTYPLENYMSLLCYCFIFNTTDRINKQQDAYGVIIYLISKVGIYVKQLTYFSKTIIINLEKTYSNIREVFTKPESKDFMRYVYKKLIESEYKFSDTIDNILEGKGKLADLDYTEDKKYVIVEDTTPKCDVCKLKHVKLMRCGRCRKKYYCSRNCQLKDFPDHKLNCKTL